MHLVFPKVALLVMTAKGLLEIVPVLLSSLLYPLFCLKFIVITIPFNLRVITVVKVIMISHLDVVQMLLHSIIPFRLIITSPLFPRLLLHLFLHRTHFLNTSLHNHPACIRKSSRPSLMRNILLRRLRFLLRDLWLSSYILRYLLGWQILTALAWVFFQSACISEGVYRVVGARATG